VKKQFYDGLILIALFCLVVASAWQALSSPPYLIATVGLTLGACIFRAYRRGIYLEFVTLLRFFGSLTLGWYLSADVGRALGLPLMLATVSGFYLTFITLYLVSGALIKRYSKKDAEPSIPEKILGALLGGFEGIILAWVLVFTLSLLPNSKVSEYYPQFSQFTGPVENMLAPVMPEEAAQTVQMVKTVQRITQNFKPEKVDRAALQEIILPLAEMPEMVALQEDESLRKLIEKRDFQAMLNHPALRNFLESEELRNRMQNIDLKRLERALVPQLYEKQRQESNNESVSPRSAGNYRQN
jgi:uncharacterized membrane protein required for colicin V production